MEFCTVRLTAMSKGVYLPHLHRSSNKDTEFKNKQAAFVKKWPRLGQRWKTQHTHTRYAWNLLYISPITATLESEVLQFVVRTFSIKVILSPMTGQCRYIQLTCSLGLLYIKCAILYHVIASKEGVYSVQVVVEELGHAVDDVKGDRLQNVHHLHVFPCMKSNGKMITLHVLYVWITPDSHNMTTEKSC